MSTPSTSLVTGYTCKVCRKILTVPGPPIIGESFTQAMSKVSGMLSDHLGKEHRDRMATIMLSGTQFSGWLVWDQYDHNNAELKEHANNVRVTMRRHLKRVVISDEMIEQRVKNELGLCDPAISLQTVKLLREMRDALDETPGK